MGREGNNVSIRAIGCDAIEPVRKPLRVTQAQQCLPGFQKRLLGSFAPCLHRRLDRCGKGMLDRLASVQFHTIRDGIQKRAVMAFHGLRFAERSVTFSRAFHKVKPSRA